MITEKPEGKKQSRKFLLKTKRQLKSSTQPTIFNLCFLKLSLLENGKVQTLLSLSIAVGE